MDKFTNTFENGYKLIAFLTQDGSQSFVISEIKKEKYKQSKDLKTKVADVEEEIHLTDNIW